MEGSKSGWVVRFGTAVSEEGKLGRRKVNTSWCLVVVSVTGCASVEEIVVEEEGGRREEEVVFGLGDR